MLKSVITFFYSRTALTLLMILIIYFFYLFLVQNGFLLFQKISLLWKNVHFFRIFQGYYRHTHGYRVSFNAWRLLNWMSCLNEESMYPFLVVIELQLQCPIMLRCYDRVSRWSSTIREFYWDLSAQRLGFSLLAGLWSSLHKRPAWYLLDV